MIQNRPIGVFDSGIGGLTAMKELIKLLPNEDIIYFGDTARVPYGSHSRETIIRYAKQDLSFLLNKNVKAVLVACGTVSANAMDALRAMTDISIIGVINAAAAKAVQKTKKKKTAILATSASINSKAYSTAIHRYDPSVQTIEKACPLFVPLIENGYADCDNPITQMVVKDYLRDIVLSGADTLILGCTHYPFLKRSISAVLPDVRLIDGNLGTARQLRRVLENNDLISDAASGDVELYSSRPDMIKVMKDLLMSEI